MFIKNFLTKYKTPEILFFLCAISALLFSTFQLSFAASAKREIKKDKDLTIFEGTQGFFEVPLSSKGISNSELPVESPVLAVTDTMILRENSPVRSGISIYNITEGQVVTHVAVGDGSESALSASSFGIGEFTLIKTKKPYECSEVTLSQCKSKDGYLTEKFFSVTKDGISEVKEVVGLVATTTPATETLMIPINVLLPEILDTKKTTISKEKDSEDSSPMVDISKSVDKVISNSLQGIVETLAAQDILTKESVDSKTSPVESVPEVVAPQPAPIQSITQDLSAPGATVQNAEF